MEISRREFIKMSGVLPLVPIVEKVENQLSWEIPTAAEVQDLFSHPEFFTKERDDKTLFTRQFDETQYQFEGMTEDQQHPILNTACGPAVLTTALKTYEYLKTGVIPDVTIHHVIKNLQQGYDHRGKEVPFIYSTGMYLAGLQKAFEKLGQGLFRTVTFNKYPPNGPNGDYFVDVYRIQNQQFPTITQLSQEEVLEKGGMMVAFFKKYGPMSGHFALFPDMDFLPNSKETEVVVLDPRGHEMLNMPGGGRSGIVDRQILRYYLLENEKTVMMGVFGIVPDFLPSPKDKLKKPWHELA